MNLLVTRPSYDYTTRFISMWAKDVIDHAKSKGFAVLDLEGERANKDEFESMIKKHTPAGVFLNGHGNQELVAGHDGVPIVAVGVNEEILKGTIVYALACASAKKLGPETVSKGARAYIGYKDDFVFLYSSEKRTRPTEDRTAMMFLEPSNQVMNSLIKGNTVAKSHASGKQAFSRNIRHLLTSQTSTEDTSSLRYLFWNMQNLAYSGDPEARLG